MFLCDNYIEHMKCHYNQILSVFLSSCFHSFLLLSQLTQRIIPWEQRTVYISHNNKWLAFKETWIQIPFFSHRFPLYFSLYISVFFAVVEFSLEQVGILPGLSGDPKIKKLNIKKWIRILVIIIINNNNTTVSFRLHWKIKVDII